MCAWLETLFFFCLFKNFLPIFEINMWCHHSFLMVFNQEYGYVIKLFLMSDIILANFHD